MVLFVFFNLCIDGHGSLVIFRSASVRPKHLFDPYFDQDYFFKRHLKRRHSQLKTANDEDSNLIQMADLYSGAAAFCWNGGMRRDSNISIGRKELGGVIRKNYVGVALDKNSKPMGPFVIWKFTNSSNEQDGPSPTAPGNVINFP